MSTHSRKSSKFRAKENSSNDPASLFELDDENARPCGEIPEVLSFGSAGSMVRHLRDKTDWGRLLFDICWGFNSRLAEYLAAYARDYDAGRICREEFLAEARRLSGRRDALIREKERLRSEARDAKLRWQDGYRRYAASRVSSRELEGWRQWYVANETGDLVEQARHEFLAEKYLSGIDARNALFRRQRELQDEADLAEDAERRYNEEHLFEVRDLGQRSRSLSRMSERHAVRLGHRMSDDAIGLRTFILSEEQAERLMATCLTILNQYTNGGDFIKFDPVSLKERTVQRIDEYFTNYQHNYDFLTGCYDDDGKGGLRLKGQDELSRHFYNGYYMTIKGFVQKSYDAARHEMQMTDSIDDEGTRERRSVNSSADEAVLDAVPGRPASYAALNSVDEGMVSLWMDCAGWIRNRLAAMGEEAARRLSDDQRAPSSRLGACFGGRRQMEDVFSVVLDRIGDELSSGRRIGKHFRDIVYDSIGGLHEEDEFPRVVCVVREILSKYLNRYAVHTVAEKYGEEYPGIEEALVERQDCFAPVLSSEIRLF